MSIELKLIAITSSGNVETPIQATLSKKGQGKGALAIQVDGTVPREVRMLLAMVVDQFAAALRMEGAKEHRTVRVKGRNAEE